MYLPRVTRKTLAEYVNDINGMDAYGVAAGILNEIQIENPHLHGVICQAVKQQPNVETGAKVLEFMLLVYKLLKMQAEADLLDKLFE